MKRTKKKRPSPLVPKQLGKSMVSKKPWKCQAYRDYVKQLPCLICASPAVDAHHIRETLDRTMGRRISDVWVVPLCRAHHNDLHAHSRTFWSDVIMDPQIFCADTFKRWSLTKLGAAAIAALAPN